MEDLKDRAIIFLMEKKRALIAGVFVMAGLAVLGVYFQTAPGPESYILAEQAVAAWREKDDDASYNTMRKALKKVPSLEKKYSGLIAQKLFQRNRLQDAIEQAQATIGALKEEAPFHALYSEMTILIEKGEFQSALEKSVGLKEQMMQSGEMDQGAGRHLAGGSLLFAHNLLRIACLQQKLNNKPGEKAAWDDLESFLGIRSSLQKVVFGAFRDNGLDLSDYIAERKKSLSC